MKAEIDTCESPNVYYEVVYWTMNDDDISCGHFVREVCDIELGRVLSLFKKNPPAFLPVEIDDPTRGAVVERIIPVDNIYSIDRIHTNRSEPKTVYTTDKGAH